MLPAIGLMVGATGGMVGIYIFVRMCQLFNDDETPTGIQVLAVLGIIGSLVGMLILALMSVDLINAGMSASRGLGNLD